MQKIRIEISDRLLEEITVKDARGVKERLDAHKLTLTWLKARLREEYGIEFKSRSNLPDLLSGRWALGINGRKIIYCACRILDRYETVFPMKGGEHGEEK